MRNINIDNIGHKPLVWLGDSRKVIRGFPKAARQRAGQELLRTQEQREPFDWKPMPTVGLGVKEIRIRVAGERRVLYLAKFAEAVYVIHAFEKKVQRTPKPDIEIGRSRFRQLMAERRTRWQTSSR